MLPKGSMAFRVQGCAGVTLRRFAFIRNQELQQVIMSAVGTVLVEKDGFGHYLNHLQGFSVSLKDVHLNLTLSEGSFSGVHYSQYM